MKFRNKVKSIMLLILTSITLISCNYILENDQYKDEVLGKAQTRIRIDKQEAKLLLKASKNNLDILEICETIKYVDKQNNVSHLTTNLEKTHFEIAENYNKLAKDKLISIPNYMKISNEFKDIEGINDEAFIKKKLKLILNKTETQIELLDALGNTTNNVEFKVLAIKDTHTLKSNINKIEVTLNNLKQQFENISTKKLIL